MKVLLIVFKNFKKLRVYENEDENHNVIFEYY